MRSPRGGHGQRTHLARLCPRLSNLRVHFQTIGFADAATGMTVLPPSDGELAVRREDCALKCLDLGDTYISGSTRTVALVLLRIFPRVCDFEYMYSNRRVRGVIETIGDYGRVDASVSPGQGTPKHVHIRNDVQPGESMY